MNKLKKPEPGNAIWQEIHNGAGTLTVVQPNGTTYVLYARSPDTLIHENEIRLAMEQHGHTEPVEKIHLTDETEADKKALVEHVKHLHHNSVPDPTPSRGRKESLKK